jgi:hypothetical protein
MTNDRRTVTATENRILFFARLSGLLLTMIGAILWYTSTSIIAEISSISDSVTEMRAQLAETRISVTGNRREREIWVRRIIENSERINLLQNNVSVRKDPFTGTEGKAMDKRLRELEAWAEGWRQ